MAKILVNKQDVSDTAIQALNDTAAIDAEYPGLSFYKALFFYNKGEMENSKIGFLDAINRDPQNYEASYYLGDILYKQGQYQAAHSSFDKAV